MLTYFGPFGNHYTCHAKNFVNNCANPEITSVSGSHKPGKSSSDVTQVYIDNQKSECIPKKLGDSYPNLKVLCVRNAGVIKISDGDLNGLGNLETLDLGWNKIKLVPKDFFNSTPKLQQLSIRFNKLVVLHASSFLSLNSLRSLWLDGNCCVTRNFMNADQIRSNLLQQAENDCTIPDVDFGGANFRQQLGDLEQSYQLKLQENADLNAKLQKKETEIISKQAKIDSMNGDINSVLEELNELQTKMASQINSKSIF